MQEYWKNWVLKSKKNQKGNFTDRKPLSWVEHSAVIHLCATEKGTSGTISHVLSVVQHSNQCKWNVSIQNNLTLLMLLSTWDNINEC